MTKLFQGLSLAFLLLAAAIVPASAQGGDPAAATVQGFYDSLVASMKAGGSAKSRYEKLKPGVEQAFDLAGMTALSVGPGWAAIAEPDQKALTEAFGRFTIANYVRNFDGYHGEKFTVDPAVAQRGTDKFVKSTLKPGSGDPVILNYRVHQVGSDWKILDVYLAGNISTLAQKRADFASTLASGGAQALAKRINALADQMLG